VLALGSSLRRNSAVSRLGVAVAAVNTAIRRAIMAVWSIRVPGSPLPEVIW
jgi:hypothetical protein